jgi:hypothetical protein
VFTKPVRQKAVRGFIAVSAFLGIWAFEPVALSATVQLYTNQSAWQATVPGHVDIGFEGIAPNFGYVLEPTPPGLTLSNVNFSIDHTSNNGSLYVIGPNYYYTSNSALSSQQSAPGSQNFLITLPAGVHALSLDYGDLSGSGGATIKFTLSTGNSFTGTTVPYNGPNGPSWFAFIGLTSDTAISSLEIVDVSQSSGFEIDNFSYGLIQVPEPGTVGVLGCGALIFGLRYRGQRGKSVRKMGRFLVSLTSTHSGALELSPQLRTDPFLAQ